jgi:heme oxygenase
MSVLPKATSLMQRLREETRGHHQRAEQRRLQRDLIAGRLPRATYIALLEQRYLVHEALESLLRDWRGHDPARLRLVQDDWFQAPAARADLSWLGVDAGGARPIEATRSLIDEIRAAAGQWSLLGFHYVFEGSKNGGRYVAKSVQTAYAFPLGEGVRYFDPHGAQQQPIWQEFKAAMDDLALTASQEDEIVAAAGAAFDGVSAIDDALYGEG